MAAEVAHSMVKIESYTISFCHNFRGCSPLFLLRFRMWNDWQIVILVVLPVLRYIECPDDGVPYNLHVMTLSWLQGSSLHSNQICPYFGLPVMSIAARHTWLTFIGPGITVKPTVAAGGLISLKFCNWCNVVGWSWATPLPLSMHGRNDICYAWSNVTPPDYKHCYMS